MAAILNSDVKAQTLDARVSNLEKALQVNGNTFTIQVGSSKIVISPSEIRLESAAAITIRCAGNLTIESTSNAGLKATGTLTVTGGQVKGIPDNWST